MITAVDIGATKTLVAQFNVSQNPIHEIKFATPKNQNDFLHQLQLVLNELPKISCISVGAPGIVNNGIILRCGILPWENFDLSRWLKQVYACPVFIENDANLAGLAEINALKTVPQVGIYITISTGIGGGIILNGQLLEGLKLSEPGFMTFNFNGQWQTWEDFASGSAIKKSFQKLAKDIESPNDWQKIASNISVGLSALIPILQPNIIVIGGSIGGFFDNYYHFLAEQLSRQLPNYISLPTIAQAQHPDEAVLFGCYYYAKHQTKI